MQPKKTGGRVQIYLPADLLERWIQIPRYERSAIAQAALRAWWGSELEVKKSKMTHNIAQADDLRTPQEGT